jgi:hypothetical protein
LIAISIPFTTNQTFSGAMQITLLWWINCTTHAPSWITVHPICLNRDLNDTLYELMSNSVLEMDRNAPLIKKNIKSLPLIHNHTNLWLCKILFLTVKVVKIFQFEKLVYLFQQQRVLPAFSA